MARRQSLGGFARPELWCLSIFCFFDLQHNGALAEAFGAVPVSLVNKFLGLCKYVFRTGPVCPGGYVFLHTRPALPRTGFIWFHLHQLHRFCHTNPQVFFFAMHPSLEHANNSCADFLPSPHPGFAVMWLFLVFFFIFWGGVYFWCRHSGLFSLGLWVQQSLSMCTQPACFKIHGEGQEWIPKSCLAPGGTRNIRQQ